MLCQKCHKKTASVFISSIINGQETRMYLCSDCAKDYPLFNFNFQEPFSIKDVMDKFNIDENNQSDEQYDKLLATDEESTDKDIICSNCYTTYAEYRETGKLALEALQLPAYLECGMCLGEGTGAVIGAKLFDFALAAYTEAASFQQAQVTPYQPL